MKSAFDMLNTQRMNCGFGPLAQSNALDLAADKHAIYLVANTTSNGLLLTHDEDPALPNFYAATPSERVTKAGYGWLSTGEVGATVNANHGAAGGAEAINYFLSAPYHALMLIGPSREVGLGAQNYNAISTAYVGEVAVPTGQTPQTHAGVLTYPCSGSENVRRNSEGEEPPPFPSDPAAKWGAPIYISGPSDLQLMSASITDALGNPVAIKVIYGDGSAAGQTRDPQGLFKSGMTVVIPEDTLSDSSNYTVTVSWTAGGGTGSSTFTFKTGVHP